MKMSRQKAMRDLNTAIRDLRSARIFVKHIGFENDDQEIMQTLQFVETTISHLSMLRLKDPSIKNLDKDPAARVTIQA